MLYKVLVFLVLFFAFQSIQAIYINVFHQLNLFTSLIILVISIILSVLFFKRFNLKNENFSINFKLILIIFILFILFLLIPSFVIPNTCSDLMNDSINLLHTLKQNGFNYGFLFSHIYPGVFTAISASLYFLIPNSYVVSSLLAVLFQLISFSFFYLIIKKWFNEKIALLSSFIFIFSITNLFVLDHGFLTQLMGQAFLIISIYFFSTKKRFFSLFSIIPLIGYPHFFLVYLLFLFFNVIRDKKISYFREPIISLLIMFPETIGILFGFLFNPLKLRNILLIKGGALVPNPLFMPIYFISIIGIYLVFFKLQKDLKYNNLKFFFYSLLIPIILIFLAFIVNLFLKFTIIRIHQFYMPVKFFYLLLMPLSVFVAIPIQRFLFNKKRFSSKFFKYTKVIIIVLLLFQLIYFSGYVFLFKGKTNLPQDFNLVVDYLHSIDKEFTLSVDSCMLKNDWVQVWPYSSLFDVPDNGLKDCPKLELNRVLEFNFTERLDIEGKKMIFNKNSKELVVKYDSFDVNYFITNCKKLNYPIVFESNGIKVYKIH